MRHSTLPQKKKYKCTEERQTYRKKDGTLMTKNVDLTHFQTTNVHGTSQTLFARSTEVQGKRNVAAATLSGRRTRKRKIREQKEETNPC